MYTTNLRRVGGSVMLALPPALLALLHLRAGATVDVAVEGERLVVEAKHRPRYSLDELLSQCTGTAELTREDRAWIDAKPVGAELL